MDILFFLAILLGKTISLLLKLSGSGATAAPGLYALKIDPNLVKKLSKKIAQGSIIVSGTNGKTTTSRLIFEILSTKYNIIHNRQGSNLLRGIASTLIKHSSIFGKLNFDLAIWEIDEATLPAAIDNTSPKSIVLLNLFRDQLDRYGEVDSLREKWQKALTELPKSSNLLLNADDPGLAVLDKTFKGKITYFGVADKSVNLPQVSQVIDVKHCPICNSKLIFTTRLSSHLGNYQCSKCDFKRPAPSVLASNLAFKSDFSVLAKLTIYHSQFTIHYKLPGLYNVYNILAASSTSVLYKIDAKTIKSSIEKYTSAFGRFELIQIHDQSVLIFLIKNPTGANEVLRVLALQGKLNLLVLLNDKIADGKDVSWIWDTNWEILKDKVENITISGTRVWDIALRLKYAGYKLSKKSIYKEISYSIQNSLDKLSKNNTLIILPTYTAMLEVQKNLHKLGGDAKWHKN